MKTSRKLTATCATAGLLAFSGAVQARPQQDGRQVPAASAAAPAAAADSASAPAPASARQCGLNAAGTACSRPPALCRGCALLRRLQGDDELDDLPADPADGAGVARN